MIETSVPTTSGRAPSADGVLAALAGALEELSPQLRKAASHVLDNPGDVALASVRELADAAQVKPNSVVRMARAIGFAGFEDFREPFRDQLRAPEDFPGRARRLQGVATEGRHGSLFVEMADAAFGNIDGFFANTSADSMRAVADDIVASNRTFVIGVGANYALAHNFVYLARMAIDNVVAVPNDGNVPTDDVVRAGTGDVVVAMTFAPYRSEVVEAAEIARENGAAVVAITDSYGSPIAAGAEHTLIVPTDTPQFFPSTLAAAACLETLVAFIVGRGGKNVVEAIDEFHQRRYDLGVYWSDE